MHASKCFQSLATDNLVGAFCVKYDADYEFRICSQLGVVCGAALLVLCGVAATPPVVVVAHILLPERAYAYIYVCLLIFRI